MNYKYLLIIHRWETWKNNGSNFELIEKDTKEEIIYYLDKLNKNDNFYLYKIYTNAEEELDKIKKYTLDDLEQIGLSGFIRTYEK